MSRTNPAATERIGAVAAGGRDRRPLIAAVLLIPIVIGLALAAFAWPAARLAPRDLPIGLAGPQPAAAAVEQRLASEEEAFDVHRYADQAAARAAIEDREVYGAIVASPDGVTVLTASAASPLVAQLLTQAFTTPQPGAAPAPAATVVDVVPTDSDDPRGSALAASVLPLVLAGIAIGAVLALAKVSALERTAALVVASTVTGLIAVGVTQGWLGVLGGSWLVNAGVFALAVFAIASTIVGLTALIGRAGLPLGALLMVLIGNPFSGIATAPELLPEPAGLIGQLLPPGAGGNLLRSTAFFEGAGAGGHLTVLLVWSALGLAMIGLGALVSRRRSHAPAAPAEVPAGGPVRLHAS